MLLSLRIYCGVPQVTPVLLELFPCFSSYHYKVSLKKGINFTLSNMICNLIFFFLTGYTGKLSSIFRRQTAYKTDERVRLMDEIISGIQVIKMYAWEIPFAKLIKTARRKELKIVTKLSYVRGLFMTFNLFTTRVALFSALITIALTDQPITASTVSFYCSFFITHKV